MLGSAVEAVWPTLTTKAAVFSGQMALHISPPIYGFHALLVYCCRPMASYVTRTIAVPLQVALRSAHAEPCFCSMVTTPVEGLPSRPRMV